MSIALEAFRKLQLRELPTRFGISTSEGILYKQVKDIIRLEAQQNYTEFSLANDRKKILASLNLGEYEDQFGPYMEFMRVHRSHLVNPYHFKQWKNASGKLSMVLHAEIEVPVSRSFTTPVKQAIQLATK